MSFLARAGQFLIRFSYSLAYWQRISSFANIPSLLFVNRSKVPRNEIVLGFGNKY